jgi:hypothetical protein
MERQQGAKERSHTKLGQPGIIEVTGHGFRIGWLHGEIMVGILPGSVFGLVTVLAGIHSDKGCAMTRRSHSDANQAEQQLTKNRVPSTSHPVLHNEEAVICHPALRAMATLLHRTAA